MPQARALACADPASSRGGRGCERETHKEQNKGAMSWHDPGPLTCLGGRGGGRPSAGVVDRGHEEAEEPFNREHTGATRCDEVTPPRAIVDETQGYDNHRARRRGR